MSPNVSVGSGGVGESVSMVSAASGASGDELDKDDEEESADGDDEQDVDEIDHTKLPQEMLHASSPLQVSYSRVDLISKRGWDQYLLKAPEAVAIPAVQVVVAGDEGGGAVAGFFAPRRATQAAPATVAPLTTATVALTVGAAQLTAVVGLNETAAVQYYVMTDLLDADIFKV